MYKHIYVHVYLYYEGAEALSFSLIFLHFRKAESDFQWLDDTWKMAKDFNLEFKMKSWVIHYEVFLSEKHYFMSPFIS